MADVIVVGGGIIGLSTAWSLRRRGIRSVLVVEKGLCGHGSTAKATGGIRCQFGAEVNVRLSLASLPYFQDWEAIHGGDVAYHAVGYTFLATSPAHLEAQSRGAAVQRACGARVELLTPLAVSEQLPGVDMSGVLGASFGPDDGLADPGAAVSSLFGSCRRAGVAIEEGVEVVRLVVESDGVRGVETGGRRIDADVVIVAAGPWSAPLLSRIGCELPVTPQHRQVYRAVGVERLPAPCPFVVDLGTGVYFHGDGCGLVFGGGDRGGTPGYDESFRSGDAGRIIGLLAQRLPHALDARLVGGWAGIRDMTPDDIGILGPIPGVDGLLVATGFSGHGFMHAPAVGDEVARMVMGQAPGVDVSALAPSRFDTGLTGESYVF